MEAIKISEIHVFRWKCPRCWFNASVNVIDNTGKRRTELECWNCRYVVHRTDKIDEKPASQPEIELPNDKVRVEDGRKEPKEEFSPEGENKKGTGIEGSIIQYLSFQERPMTEEEIMRGIRGKTGLKRKALRKLVQDGTIKREGSGVKGNVFKYSCS